MAERRAALVTGATSGIGVGIVRALAAAGCDVMLCGFGEADRIDALSGEIAAAHGVRVLYHPADLSIAVEVERLVRAAEAAFGRVDVLCNNAGVLNVPSEPVEKVDPVRWERTFAVNVTAPFHAIRLLLPGMRARNWGRIVNTASAAGLVGMENSAPYVASKHAVVGLTKAVALEVAATGVTCNAVCPGLVATEFVADRIRAAAARRGEDEAAIARRATQGRQPSGRLVSVDEVAGLVAYLCSDGAGSINGAAIPVDQAWTAM